MKLDMRTPVKPESFEIENDEGVIKVAFTKLTIADAMEMGALQAPFISNKELPQNKVTEGLGLPKLVVSLKTLDGKRVWNSVDELEGLSGEMFFWLMTKYSEANPGILTDGDTLDDKKK